MGRVPVHIESKAQLSVLDEGQLVEYSGRIGVYAGDVLVDFRPIHTIVYLTPDKRIERQDVYVLNRLVPNVKNIRGWSLVGLVDENHPHYERYRRLLEENLPSRN